MKKYDSYKDSGVEWIGEIPEHWEYSPVKYFTEIVNGSTPSSSEESYWEGTIHWVTTDDLGKLDQKYITHTRRTITELGYKSCGTTIAPKGSVVISSRAPIGHLGILKIDACTNQGCKTLIPKNINSEFLHYFLGFGRNELEALGQGSTFKELPTSALKGFKIISPPIEEQSTIANYLDQKTTQIDDLIAKKERLIQLLEEERTAMINQAVTKGLDPTVAMKDSGIEWLGEIPEHWEVKKLKYVAEVTLGKMLTNEDKGGYQLKPYLRAKNIEWINPNVDDVKEMWFSENEIIQYRIKESDLLVSEGGEVGRTCIWQNELEESYIQNSVHKVTIVEGDPYYFLNQFVLFGKYGHFDAIVNKISIAHLTKEKLKDVVFIIPPIIEQSKISKYILNKTSEISEIQVLSFRITGVCTSNFS
jgi:type I restriction enzyme S subunit